MNVGAILDNVAGELDAQVLAYMQEYAIRHRRTATKIRNRGG